MKRLWTTIMPALLLATLVSCQHARVQLVDAAQVDQATTSVETRKLIFWVWGIFPSAHVVRAAELCPGQRIVSIYEYSSLTDGVFENISLGIYAPKTLEVTCQ